MISYLFFSRESETRNIFEHCVISCYCILVNFFYSMSCSYYSRTFHMELRIFHHHHRCRSYANIYTLSDTQVAVTYSYLSSLSMDREYLLWKFVWDYFTLYLLLIIIFNIESIHWVHSSVLNMANFSFMYPDIYVLLYTVSGRHIFISLTMKFHPINDRISSNNLSDLLVNATCEPQAQVKSIDHINCI